MAATVRCARATGVGLRRRQQPGHSASRAVVHALGLNTAVWAHVRKQVERPLRSGPSKARRRAHDSSRPRPAKFTPNLDCRPAGIHGYGCG
eukprot:356258-Chlamydomonas_euryale.AAC.9